MDLKGAEIRNFEGIICGQKKGNDSYERYKIVIPHYQRPYKWGADHVAQLIEDWHQNKNNTNNQYFAGSIVTVKDDDKKQFDLIDGQQRFTTIFLVNFLRFLLLRVMVRETNTQSSLQRRHDSLLLSLIKAQKYLNNEGSDLEEYQEFSSNYVEPEDAESDLLNKFLKYAKMPLDERELDSQVYFAKHQELLKKMFSNQPTTLEYDRSYFNSLLTDALARVSITLHSQLPRPQLNILDYEDEEKELKKSTSNYINAIETIFNTFNTIVNSENNDKKLNSFSIAEKIVAEMDNFLENIHFCVIETGNTDDAYTLFEVLNDRSLALDNLDLLKNQFYRNFVLNNPSNDIKKDQYISELDDQWYDEIFKKSLPESAKKLIVFLGVSYITGDTSLSIKQPDKFIRDSINKKYLMQFNSDNAYSVDNFKRDFNIFQACEIFLNEAGTRYRSEKNKAYQSAYGDSTILDKTIHLLKALKQDTVLAGLFSFIFNYLKTEKNITDFNPAKIKKYAVEFLHEKLPEKIEKQVANIWMLAMKAKDYKPVLRHSSSLLKKNCLHSDKLHIQEISIELKKEVDFQFLNWLRTWTYTPSNTFKLRMLFAHALQLEMTDSGELRQSKSFYTKLQKEHVLNLDVDHMEPIKINSDTPYLYFSDPDRESIINQLGNMMILTSSENRRKSNSPMEKVFESLKEAGLENHYLTTKTKELLEDSNNHVNDSYNKKVPNKNFFEKRKEFLIDTFNKAVDFSF
ncbi:DUF262 domain-containing protein [Ignatzschineria cameli]|uniref:DUF262 domain-containing protein n=1 Tax=Ignatzschineria cameli TaxID=2182793 RepID=A0A2U2AKC6_9GAMM|nr:DUF262 domain-containing protein [Ignatzschineria cameli]PWD83306.1 hypothetical protein DC077_10115 [Ignatzschineria cameli]